LRSTPLASPATHALASQRLARSASLVGAVTHSLIALAVLHRKRAPQLCTSTFPDLVLRLTPTPLPPTPPPPPPPISLLETPQLRNRSSRKRHDQDWGAAASGVRGGRGLHYCKEYAAPWPAGVPYSWRKGAKGRSPVSYVRLPFPRPSPLPLGVCGVLWAVQQDRPKSVLLCSLHPPPPSSSVVCLPPPLCSCLVCVMLSALLIKFPHSATTTPIPTTLFPPPPHTHTITCHFCPLTSLLLFLPFFLVRM
jgi:hypothetical protein